MKKMKKLLSMLLAVVMVLAMAAPSFAENSVGKENEGKITIDNPKDDMTYIAYQIFGVTYTDYDEGEGENITTKRTYAYTIDENSTWFQIVSAYANEHPDEIQLVKITTETSLYKVNVSTKENGESKLNGAAFAAKLKAFSVSGSFDDTNIEKVQLQKSGNVVVASNIKLGYYFVVSKDASGTTAAVCNLTTTEPEVTIHDKNKIIFEKTDDKVGVDIGDEVTYTITSAVPDTTGFTEFYDFIITDKMSDGLTFDINTLELTIGDRTWTKNELEADESFSLQGNVIVDKDGNVIESLTGDTGEKRVDFRLVIPVKNYTYNTAITVKYKATVNKDAINKIEENTAELHYSNDPTTQTSRDRLEDKEDVYSVSILVDKTIAGTETRLAGAKFILRKTVGTGDDAEVTYYKENKSGNDVIDIEWVSDQDEATSKQTDSDGKASFEGIKKEDIDNKGNEIKIKYDLIEIEAPAGYNLLESPQEVTLNILKPVIVNGVPQYDNEGKPVMEAINPLNKNEDGTYKYGYISHTTNLDFIKDLSFVTPVQNNRGTILPSTGGIGTTIFYAAGIILMAGAVFFVVRRKKA